MLKKLRLHNFKTYLNAEIPFSPLHLIIGRNNSGKTNLCAALRFLGATASTDLQTSATAAPGGIPEMKNWAFDSNQIELTCECELPYDGQPNAFTYDLTLTVVSTSAVGALPALAVSRERLTLKSARFGSVELLWSNGHEARMLHEEDHLRGKPRDPVKTLAPRDSTMLSRLYELETNRRALLFRRYLASWSFFSLNPDEIRFGWAKQAPTLGFTYSASNLAIMLFQLKNMDETRYRNVIDKVKKIESSIRAINFITGAGEAPVPFVELADRKRATWVGLSDGTLRCLALAYLSEIVRPQEQDSQNVPPLVIIEEPENGLFPGSLRSIWQFFEGQASNGQFVFTSHSPYFINFFDALRESVVILRRGNGITEFSQPPPPDDNDPDRPLLAEQYSMELFD